MHGLLLQSQGDVAIDSLFNDLGMDFFENDIDEVIFQTNQFLTDSTFVGESGPFWWILQMSMALGALFAIIMGAGMGYKMLIKGEPFDVLKILRVFGIGLVMMYWYGSSGNVLGLLAYIPNAIGSYTKELYNIEAAEVSARFREVTPLLHKRDTAYYNKYAEVLVKQEKLAELERKQNEAQMNLEDGGTLSHTQEDEFKKLKKLDLQGAFAGTTIAIDKLVMILSMLFFKVGWWGTMFCQQLLLGMLTIFGPIQWAFSLLPKWEGAWAKWITRYLTVHFYGAMLYFVGFYVLLLFDLSFTIQFANLKAITQGSPEIMQYITTAFQTAGYLLIASIVSLKCLNLVPDLAAWMIPEGDTAFSTRNFGEGVASQTKQSAMSFIR